MPGMGDGIGVPTITPTSGTAPLSTTFNVPVLSGTVTSVLWTFGDGNTANTLSGTHVFSTAGTFTPSVQVNFLSGSTFNDSTSSVTVAAAPVVQLSKKVALTYQHNQDTPASTWVVPHKLGVYPIVDVFIDDNGTMKKILPLSVEYTDAGTLTITFSSAQAGIAMVA